MLLPSLLLPCILVVAVSARGKTAKDCKVGDKWTHERVRFECYEGSGNVLKGVRAIGCVPTNTDNGAMIGNRATFDDKHFTYSCTKKGELFSYKISHCRDSAGKAMKVGETRTMPDGMELSCYKDTTGEIKLSSQEGKPPKKEAPAPVPGVGCKFNGETYGPGKMWIKDVQIKGKVGKRAHLVGKGVRYQCRKGSKNGFVGIPNGCVPMSGAPITNNAIAFVNSLYVKCLITPTGGVSMDIIPEDDLACMFGKIKVKTEEKYTAPNGDVHLCHYAVTKKLACTIKGKIITKFGFVDLKEKGLFHCHNNNTAGFLEFPKTMTGCKLAKGVIKPFYGISWQNKTEMHNCFYRLKGNIVVPYTSCSGCEFKGKTVKPGKIVKEVWKKCDKVGKVYAMRDMTAEEKAAFMKPQKNVFGGRGSGDIGDLLGMMTRPPTEEPEIEESVDEEAVTTESEHDEQSPEEPVPEETPSDDLSAPARDAPNSIEEPPKPIDKILQDDIIEIITGSNLPRSGDTGRYFFKIVEELQPSKPATTANGSTTIYKVKLALTECMRARDEDRIVKPDECPLRKGADSKEIYEYLEITREKTPESITYTSKVFTH